MKNRTVALLALLLVPASVLATLGIRGRLAASSKEEQESPFPSDSCALVEPMRMDLLFDCDAVGEEFPMCGRFDRAMRKLKRRNLELQVRAMQSMWVAALLSKRIVERFESGEILFAPETAQRVFDEMFRVVKVGQLPKAPTTRRGFLQVLKCAPHTWASMVVGASRSLTDTDLSELESKLPDPATFESAMASQLGFLDVPMKKASP